MDGEAAIGARPASLEERLPRKLRCRLRYLYEGTEAGREVEGGEERGGRKEQREDVHTCTCTWERIIHVD